MSAAALAPSEAHVATPNGVRYLKQLCRQVRHRRPAEFDDERGRIEFEFGTCELAATTAELVLRAPAAEAGGRERVEQVIGSHLERFAQRESLAIVWREAAA